MMDDSKKEELRRQFSDAARRDDAEAVERLLRQGADPNGKAGAWRPIERAIHQGNAAMVAAMARHGLNLDSIEGVVGTPLSLAAGDGELECLNALLSAGADPNVGECLAGWTPLMRAAEAGQLACMVALVDAGADWAAIKPGVGRHSAKSRALIKGHQACVEFIEALELAQAMRQNTLAGQTGASPRL